MCKIIALIPCLMTDNNRKANHKAMSYAKEFYGLDEYVVNDQEFLDSDYREGFIYIGHHARQGFVNSRNQLLQYFYDSNADYAIWMDARSKISKTTLNDFLTIVNAIREGLDLDVILSTIGTDISKPRILARKMSDHVEKVRLIKPRGATYSGMNSLFMSNFNHKYKVKPYIDARCNPKEGTAEDVYFVQLLRAMFDVYLAPTIVVSPGLFKTSTWMNVTKGYSEAPKPQKDLVAAWVNEILPKLGLYKHNATMLYELSRVETYKDIVTRYKPRASRKLSRLI